MLQMLRALRENSHATRFALIQNSTVKSPCSGAKRVDRSRARELVVLTVPSWTAAAGIVIIEDVDPEKTRLPPVRLGASAPQTTPTALTTTPRPLASARGALLLAALRCTSVPATKSMGRFIDGNAGKMAALTTRKLERSPLRTRVVESPPIKKVEAEKLAVRGTAAYAAAFPFTNHTM